MVKQMAKKQALEPDSIYFTRRQIREHTDWTDWQIRTHIKQLEELEYLYVRIGSRGKEYSYALNYQGQENSRFCLNLTPVEEIKKRMEVK
jgi:hypothetical protein